MPWDDHIKRRLKLRDIDILMAVIQAGSMGKAAGRFNMTQSAVSKVIADLEQTLGVQLLDRSRRGVEPTPHGLALTKRGVTVFDELRQGIQDLDFLSDPTAGEIRVACTEPIAAAIVSPIIDRLLRQYPRMTFHVVAGDGALLCRELAERKVELVISRLTPSDPISEELSTECLFYDSLVVAAGATHPLTRRRSRIELAELPNEPWVLLPFDSAFGSLVAERFRAYGLEPPRSICATSCSRPVVFSRYSLGSRSGFPGSIRSSKRYLWNCLTRECRSLSFC